MPTVSKDLIPATALPLAYYLAAHAGFAAALLVLAIDPAVAGTSFYQPRVVALVHLLTLAWLTGSILGSLYIVAPLALGVPMPVSRADWITFGTFLFGASGMIAHFWINTYDGMAWSAWLVTGAIAWVGVRVMRGWRASRVAWGVRLHVVLAFINIVCAAALGILIGFDRSRGFLPVSPLATMFAHLHLAAVGWVAMLVIGLSYRLIPMMLPAAMPAGRVLALSAILLECGLAALTAALLFDPDRVWICTLLIAGGVASFIMQVRGMLAHRVPRPPALPRRDWSAWQTHMAIAWLLAAMSIGALLAIQPADDFRVAWMWAYGVAGLVGFLAQMVAGMQGRLVPLYAWYRAYAAAGAPPARAANALPSAAFARAIFLCWAAAVPLLAWGLPRGNHPMIRAGAIALLAGVGIGGLYMLRTMRSARR